ncbi:class I SAM-dependent RNA methyltransferase [Desulfococcus sp.]|uniref:THUMP domain-containing class I SAM-dependent RNA methyltransferase n=1 Tax=Desulfococcus sp. TaxID=2025834 RepID=UPI003593786B
MTPETPLSKRIKRHVAGRTREFFVAVSPGLESVCLAELQAPPLSIATGAVVPGGIVFEGRLHDCWLANLHLRTAGRILMRIDEFSASSFPRLEKKLADIPWELYLRPGGAPVIHAAAAKSRLYHTDAVAERVQASIRDRFKQVRPEEAGDVPDVPVQRIFVRAAEDHFTLSIDSSGELLYKRGFKTGGGKAPIRETIAAAALTLAGYDGRLPLLDPMCGSGTFSIEGAMISGGIPPGSRRSFAFMGWPSFAPRKWAYLKRTSENSLPLPETPTIFAADIDPDVCRSLRKNLEENGLSPMIDVSCRDFFAFSPGDRFSQPGLVAVNPPYGHRLGTRRQGRALFRSVCSRLREAYAGWKVVLVAPEAEWTGDIPFPVFHHPFSHGGLRPTLLIGNIP